MSNTIIPFDFNSLTIRTLLDEEGIIWFVASDICNALEYSNPRKAISDHVGTEDRKSVSLGLPGSSPTIINESGMYSLILSSHKSEAKVFKKWVTSEVLPSIRKTGEYKLKGTPTPSSTISYTPAQLENEIDALERLSTKPYKSINPNLLQRARDHAQNTLMKSLGDSLPVIGNQSSIIGVVEIAKEQLGINISNERSDIGRYVAQAFKRRGLEDSIVKIERVVNGEIRDINGFKDNHQLVAQLVQQWLDEQVKIKNRKTKSNYNNLFTE